MSVTSEEYARKPWDAFQCLSLAAGVALVGVGLRKVSPYGSLMGAFGGMLLYRGVARRSPSPADRRPDFARGVSLRRSILIDASPMLCYRFWRDLRNLPRIIGNLHSVEVISGRRSHWVMKTLGEGRVDWDAEITRDIPNEIIGWRSLPGSAMDTAGSIRFHALGQNRTQVVVTMKYNPPAGVLGAAFLDLFGVPPERQLAEDLGRFKKIIEEEQSSQVRVSA